MYAVCRFSKNNLVTSAILPFLDFSELNLISKNSRL